VVEGELHLTIEHEGDRRILPLRKGEAFHIPPRLIHRMEAIVDTDVAEVSTTELEDVVRLEDRYGRA
jgi:quercetin dioxygenase-like cupin family protein